jgi:two-component system, chemotaxis family, response regulator Rcp1
VWTLDRSYVVSLGYWHWRVSPFVIRQTLTARMGRDSQSPSILLVEDHDADATLVELGLEEMAGTVLLFRVINVDEALGFLSRVAPFELAPEPDLILLDLNLPRRGGYDLLRAIRENQSWQHIPVFILSTADNQANIEKSLSLGASGHIGKPRTWDGYQTFLRQMVDMISKRV